MRKAALTLTVILCALLAGAAHSAGTAERPAGRIPPLRGESFCTSPDGPPEMGVTYLPRAAAPPSAPLAAAAPRSGNSFGGFVRCPAGDPSNPDCTNFSLWKIAEDNTGYYRDVLFGAMTAISNPTAGEQWGMTVTRPNGERMNFAPVTYDGSCFTLSSQRVCGATHLNVYWYFRSQCAAPGQWQAEASNGGTVFAAVPFTIKPQLGTPAEVASKLPPFAQNNYPFEPYGGLCRDRTTLESFPCSEGRPGQVEWTIAETGCTLVNIASILNYHGVATDPVQLNHWLLANNFYTPAGEIYLDAPAQYARARGVNLSFEGISYQGENFLSDQICRFGPPLMRVANNTHNVIATGRDDAQSTFTILDARDGAHKELTAYGNTYDSFAVYAGPEHTFTDRSGMTFTFHSPVESFVVDPLGRRQGLDPRTGTRYDEIPGAFYGEFSTLGPVLPDGYEPPKMLDLRRPAEGAYTLTVVGTGEGTYDAEFIMHDRSLGRSLRRFDDVPTAPGAVHTYQVEFSKAEGAQLRVTGVFDGGGQRPRDVNKFLTYAQPTQGSTALPAGATSYTLLLFYGQSAIPSTFRAQLNGADITPMFSPAAGGSQAVALPLQRGRNVLQLSVDGNLPNRVATDSDRLVFDVP
jgi:hypothetical protein